MALFLVLVFLCVAPKAIGATRYTVYFYNPESNVDNFASLKTRLDVYLKDAGIASAGSEEYTRKHLKSMVGEKYAEAIDTCQILAVPKDIDALISIGFGLVQAALTTEYSLSKLSAINPGLYKKLTIPAKIGIDGWQKPGTSEWELLRK